MSMRSSSTCSSYGFKQKDLAGIIGSSSRASEVLSRRRPLTFLIGFADRAA